ncbi:Fe-S oxidoreductase [Fulvitalea axinellae]|uniref:Fe-S oxidoreductase n=1 Tax=Fulvitalea axinellae TaxID=1182444 RepID=A0AAU9CPE2_9BACT|nr:Fe-S oxidoreductase [Fulvitalea axinellae]
MKLLQQAIFVLTLATAFYLVAKRVIRIRNNILSGKPEKISGDRSQRLKNMLLVAFGQKKMFQKPIPALLHLCVYSGFLLINIEVLEIVIDGIFGTHRIFATALGAFYSTLISFFEILATLVITACVVFLIRRHILKVKRFSGLEMTRWPVLDAMLILVIEIALMVSILTMNGADQVLQTRDVGYTATGPFLLSGLLKPFFSNFSTGTLIVAERTAWWFHILGIFAFALYITYSKHFHIALAFPSTYFAKLEAKGKIKNMPEVMAEVKSMMGEETGEEETPEIPVLGAKDATDLSWKSLMDAYTCTECGRCTSNCPANLTGKMLSPRKVMMDTRDRIEEIGEFRSKNGENTPDGKSLLGNYISHEELNACTTCNACTDACPINLDPLSIIIQLRRHMAMEESSSPNEWNMMFANIENNFAPWKFPASDRFNWATELANEKPTEQKS